jgi:hypothetical protein
VSPVRYKLGFYIPEDDILHSHCHEDLKSYETVTNDRADFRKPFLSDLKISLLGNLKIVHHKPVFTRGML